MYKTSSRVAPGVWSLHETDFEAYFCVYFCVYDVFFLVPSHLLIEVLQSLYEKNTNIAHIKTNTSVIKSVFFLNNGLNTLDLMFMG